MRYDYIFIVTAKIKKKKKKSPNTGKGVEKFIHSFGVIRKVKCTATLERVWKFITKLNMWLPYNLEITLLAIYPWEVKRWVPVNTCT